MKKLIIGILLIVIIIIATFCLWYNRNLQELKNIESFNKEFEGYLNREISGVDLTTIINKAIENNNKFEISKNKDGTFKNDNKNSIEIIIKPSENRKSLSNGGF